MSLSRDWVYSVLNICERNCTSSAGATHVTAYIMGSSSFLSILGYVGGGALNTLNAGISDLLAMGVAAAVTYATWRDANVTSRG